MRPTLFILPILTTDHRTWIDQWLIEQKISLNPESDITVYWTNHDQQSLSIEMVRELITELQFFAQQQKLRYVVILRLDQGSDEAQNALLKTLEEATANTQFIITAQDKSSLLPTILSRCVVQYVKPIWVEESSLPISPSDIVFTSYGQAISLAEQLQDRTEAQVKLKSWMNSLALCSVAKYHQQIKIINQTLLELKQNGNVRLILESCFFQLYALQDKNIETQNR